MSGALDGKSRMKGGLWGSLVGDALGVPVEFQGRSARVADPVLGMRAYGTHRQPAGTWSDDGINSDGYVIDTLEAAVWCLLTTDDFGSCLLKAVNLGGDTDTTGCVAGGLAGVLYGEDSIPETWRGALPRQRDLAGLIDCFVPVCESKEQVL